MRLILKIHVGFHLNLSIRPHHSLIVPPLACPLYDQASAQPQFTCSYLLVEDAKVNPGSPGRIGIFIARHTCCKIKEHIIKPYRVGRLFRTGRI